MSPSVFLVGAGPGDPGLLTLRAAEVLAAADVVLYDGLANPALLRHAPPSALCIAVEKHGRARCTQEEIHALLLEHARAGRTVVRLKGGDPFVFGRGGEEAEALTAAGIPWEVVPGVTAGVAVPAYAGIPVTHRDLAASVTFVAGHEAVGKPYSTIDWAGLAPATGTVVFFMGARRLRENLAHLVAAGRAPHTPAAIIEWGTLPRQRTVLGTLADLADRAEAARIWPPALVVVGAVAHLRDQLAWLERRPLFGRRVVVTRPRAEADPLLRALLAAGAEALPLPVVELAPCDPGPLDAALAGIGRYGLLVVTSKGAVARLAERLDALGLDARALAGLRVAAVGPGTAATLRTTLGVRADYVAAEPRQEGLLAALSGLDLRAMQVLWPASALARPALAEALRAAGAVVDVVATHTARPADPASLARELEALSGPPIDALTFSSGSAIDAFFEVLGEPRARALCASATAVVLGPVTRDAALARGLPAPIVAPSVDDSGIVAALCAHFPQRSPDAIP